jgi:hypothetical protein
MAEQQELLEAIRKGEERLHQSKATLARLKSAEVQSARIIADKSRTTKSGRNNPMLA